MLTARDISCSFDNMFCLDFLERGQNRNSLFETFFGLFTVIPRYLVDYIWLTPLGNPSRSRFENIRQTYQMGERKRSWNVSVDPYTGSFGTYPFSSETLIAHIEVNYGAARP